jgi:meiotic recombination protein DMC1
MGFTSALEKFREMEEASLLSTGCEALDRLIGGGLKPKAFHLFYGDKRSGVDELLHRLLVHSILPREIGGLGERAVYINCGNYRIERTVLDFRFLTSLMKACGVDPSNGLKEIQVVCAFSPEQEEEAALKVKHLVETDEKIGVVVFHNISRLFTTDRRSLHRKARITLLQRIVSETWRTCFERDVILVATCRPLKGVRSAIPPPEGGGYLRHTATVIVYLKKMKRDAYVAHLIKHPSLPQMRVNFTFRGGDGLGRVTGSFRKRFQEELNELERSFIKALRDPKRREAFDSLVKAWGSEQGAMSYADVPTVLDVMLLTAVLDNRKRIEELADQLNEVLSKLREMLGS